MLKRRFASSSSSDNATAVRPTRPIPQRPRRLRKVQRISSSHCVASIESSLQHPRVAVAPAEDSDTEISSSETELGTALSEIEAVVQSGKGRAPPSPSSDGSPERDGDEVDETLGRATMSPSPSPGFWSAGHSKTAYVIPVSPTMRNSGRDKEGSDRKRRRVEVDDEADDEMEAENLLITPKPKVLRRKEKHALPPLAATPSILGLTARLLGLTPYSMDMQTSPDQAILDGHSAAHVSDGDAKIGLSERETERALAWAPCPLSSLPVLDEFEGFDLPTRPASPAPAHDPVWSYGPLSSPIRLPGDSPRAPITHRILLGSLAGQRTRPNKNLQRRSPTSLLPARNPKGRKFQSSARFQARRMAFKVLPFVQPHPLVGQQVITQIQLSKDARLTRFWAMQMAGAQSNFAAVSTMRNKCLDSLGEVDAWKSLLAEIAADCWWWRPTGPQPGHLPVSLPPAAARLRSPERLHLGDASVPLPVPHVQPQYQADEIQVEALVADMSVPSVPAPQAVVPLQTRTVSARQGMLPATSGRSRTSTRHTRGPGATARARADHHSERLLHAEAAELRARRDTARAAMRHAIALLPDRPRPHPPVPEAREADIDDAGSVEAATIVDVDADSETESVVSEPPAYNSAMYPRHIPCPPHLRPRRPPAPVEIRLPSYITNRYSRRSPSPPPPYNASTDRETLVEPRFIDSDDDEEDSREVAAVAEAVEPRMIGAFPASIAGASVSASPDWSTGRNRFDAALDMEEADADLIDELTGGFGAGQAGHDDHGQAGESALGAIGGFLGRWFGLS